MRLTKVTPLPIEVCCTAQGVHVWAERFVNGDTCTCGRFSLDLRPGDEQRRAELLDRVTALAEEEDR